MPTFAQFPTTPLRQAIHNFTFVELQVCIQGTVTLEYLNTGLLVILHIVCQLAHRSSETLNLMLFSSSLV